MTRIFAETLPTRASNARAFGLENLFLNFTPRKAFFAATPGFSHVRVYVKQGIERRRVMPSVFRGQGRISADARPFCVQAISSANIIISLKEFWRSSAESASPVSR